MDKPKPIELPPNSVIGAWKPNNLLGQGGQGAVWAAKPSKVKHTPQRALKACFASDDQGRARFVREVETLRRCDSPSILKVYDHDLEWKEHIAGLPPFAYFVGEKCQGSMEQRQAHLGDPRRRLELFKQACAALSYLHTMPDPVLHRDIKPANFLIGNELSNVVLADFGIARVFSDTTLTQAFEIVGTPYYRAPEVLHGSRGTIESDVYGLGRLLEWLLTGEVSTDMATRPVPRGLDLDDEVCNILDGVIAKATQVTPAHRYSSVQSLVDQLPSLWISVRPRPKLEPALVDTAAATVLPVALELARADDMLGWRQLQNQLRRDFVERIQQWRKDREFKWPGDKNKEGGIAFTNSLLDVVMGRLVFGLAGVYSSNPTFSDQRQVVEDILSVPGWSTTGTTAIIEAPRSLVFLFQYLHGALCMNYGQIELALQLGRMPASSADRATAEPMWKQHALTGWPKLLGGDCSWAWEYARSLSDRHMVLDQFFALKSDYEVGLASYSMLMVLYELADDASTATPESLAKPDSFRMDFPPLFLGMSNEAVSTAGRKTFRNKDLVDLVATLALAKVDTMRKLWASRRKEAFRWGGEVFQHRYYEGDRDNPVPAELGRG